MFKKPILAGLMGLSLLHGSSHVSAETFDITDIVSTSISLDCIDYCVIGICVHLICTPVGCSIEYSARVSHYIPDLIVTVYDEVEEQPWEEFRPFQELLLSSIDNVGAGLMQLDKLNSQPVIFKNASAVGHPFLFVLGTKQVTTKVMNSFTDPETGITSTDGGWTYVTTEVPDYESEDAFNIDMVAADQGFSEGMSDITGDSSFVGFCSSDVTAFIPYYDSTIDLFEWRFGLIDRIKSVQNGAHIFGNREIGSLNSLNPIGENTWGAVYPRIGFVMQNEDAKAAAVIAQRAIDVATRDDVWRIQWELPGKESNEKTDKWQMISPKADSKCQSFGSKDSTWSKGRNPDGKGQYGWNYWRKYTCCMGTGPVIAHIPIAPICINDVLN